MSADRSSRWRWFPCWVVLATMAAGCLEGEQSVDSASPTVTLGTEIVSWDEQVAAVRDGTSNVIRYADVSLAPEQWQELAKGCESLETLEADFRSLTAEDLSILSELPEIKRLMLTGPLDDSALNQISQISQLEILNLPDAVFTDDGLATISSLSHLELLRFSSPHVTDVGMNAIARLPSLRFLHLIDVPITDDGLKPFHEMSQLESFYIDGGQCTDEGLRELLTALPELHFHRDQLHLPDDPLDHPHE